MNRLQIVGVAVLCAAVGAVIALAFGGGGGHTTTTVVQSGTNGSGGALPTSFKSTGKALSINQIYRQDSPGVVDIDVISTTSGASSSLFGGGGAKQEEEGEGAGVVYNKQGVILTDEHVVANAQKVTVHFQDGLSASAKVLGTDSSTDVGVIKVNVRSSELHPLSFANSSSAQVGDPVVAIGSPFMLPETTTQGIVSATGRPIQAPNGYTITGAIQTDAAINPGNSGGPLLDAQGDVLGLNDQIETANTTASGEGSSSGIGFATPGNSVLKVAKTIISGKAVQHPYLGVSLNPTSSGGAEIATTPTQSTSGTTCPSVTPGSPAATAGLVSGDLITAIDGSTITSTDQLISTLSGFKVGQTVQMTVKRGGRTKQVSVTLGNRPNTTCAG